MGRKGYPPRFRRQVLQLLDAGRPVRQIANDLEISEQTIYTWRRQQRIDEGLEPGLSSTESAELVASRKRIRELEIEVEIHKRATELLKEKACPKVDTRRSK